MDMFVVRWFVMQLYLFSIEDCAFLLVQRLIMPWRASQHCRDANRCSAAVALDLFPALVLRVMEEEEEIDCSRITGTEHRFSAHAFLDFMMGPVSQGAKEGGRVQLDRFLRWLIPAVCLCVV